MTLQPRKRSFVFFGEDVFSLAVLESLVDSKLGLLPLAVVVLEPISVSGLRLINFCKNRNIPLILSHSLRFKDFLLRFEEIEIDLIITVHFQRLLPKSIFNRAKFGALNLHPSILPRYRGMSPQHWPIVFGDSETGITVHRIDEGVDTGRILSQVKIQLDPGIYIHELQKKFLEIYPSVMLAAVEKAIAGELGALQLADGASYFHKISEFDMEITPEIGVERAGNMVRAFSFPYLGARYKELRILKAIRVNDKTLTKLRLTIAEPCLADYDNKRYLLLKDGALELIKWRDA
jgi:methionyl-tRNA formyltransferase